MKEVRALSDEMKKNWDDAEALLECLAKLRAKTFEPSVLMKLDIGRVIKRLSSHPDKAVAASALVRHSPKAVNHKMNAHLSACVWLCLVVVLVVAACASGMADLDSPCFF